MGMPSKSKIFEYWMNWLDKKGIDWGEPCCWACGRFWEDKYDIKKPRATREEIIKNWDNVPLQRCHIVAKQFDGTDEPSNLFLMCRDCHDKAPNTRSVEAFLIWTEKQNWYENFRDEVMKEIKNFGFEDRVEELNEIIANKEIKDKISENLGVHMNQNGKGAQITISTYISALYGYLKEQDKLKVSQEGNNLA
ncbi:hypothetical protein PVOR_15329 [Paenibacillus vortex V453]|uniref:HNH domain-containing protein n=2 Tax=Paenibacillus TaxID=44249 RepID=A0A2R9SUI9_9BACL|nr:hypothetical protein PVOR_15329 [Paenibacillus vortex V453]